VDIATNKVIPVKTGIQYSFTDAFIQTIPGRVVLLYQFQLP
jgi:hypothetical protein